jgi:DNA-directed RNA polymerase subunit F
MCAQANSSSLIKALIYSKFEDVGPLAIGWFPEDLDRNWLSAIALKSINLFVTEGGKVPEKLSVIPFSTIHMVGIVKCLEIKDATARGRARDATLTILIEEDNNNLILSYIDDIAYLLSHIEGRVLVREQVFPKADKTELKNVIKESFDYIIKNFEVFQVLRQDREQFLHDPKILHLKQMIAEIEKLIGGYVQNIDQFGGEEIKDVLRLSWEIKQMDLNNIAPIELRQIFDLANILKIKKDSILLQKQKLAHVKNQLTPERIEKLNDQISLIVSNLELFIEQLVDIIGELAKRSENVILKQGVDFIFRKQFERLRYDLRQQFDLFQEIEHLPSEQFQEIRETYISLEKMRTLKNNKEVGRLADKMAQILGSDRDFILQATRNLKIKADFSRIFQLL